MTHFEHANITVPNIDASIAFLAIAAPDFRVKADVTPKGEKRWVHIGNDEHYFALQEPKDIKTFQDQRNPYQDIGVNHLAMIVDDLEHKKRNLLKAGYRINGDLVDEPYRKRVYFFDSAGFEWELVEYFTDEPSLRYQY